MKPTKTNITKVVIWTTTKYNDWLGYGTKKQAVADVLEAFKHGEIITLKCASPAGENPQRGSRKYWKTKSSGNSYVVDGIKKTILNVNTNELTNFNP